MIQCHSNPEIAVCPWWGRVFQTEPVTETGTPRRGSRSGWFLPSRLLPRRDCGWTNGSGSGHMLGSMTFVKVKTTRAHARTRAEEATGGSLLPFLSVSSTFARLPLRSWFSDDSGPRGRDVHPPKTRPERLRYRLSRGFPPSSPLVQHNFQCDRKWDSKASKLKSGRSYWRIKKCFWR